VSNDAAILGRLLRQVTGECRVCRCKGDSCSLPEGGRCVWTDSLRTLCSNPACQRAAGTARRKHKWAQKRAEQSGRRRSKANEETQGEGASGMSRVAVIDMVKCQGGGCFARIRPGERFCTKCEQMYVDLEVKRITALQRAAPPYTGPDFCEMDSLPNLLLEVTPRELAGFAAACVAAGGLALLGGTLLFLGAKVAVAWLLKVSA
jgi:hypothetical protein